MIPSHYKIISPEEKSILHALKNEQLTSLQILKKVDSISGILNVYNMLDKLKEKEVVGSYVKNDRNYHYAL
jgi:Fe2+ or Zn2+ uptake regulation protein